MQAKSWGDGGDEAAALPKVLAMLEAIRDSGDFPGVADGWAGTMAELRAEVSRLPPLPLHPRPTTTATNYVMILYVFEEIMR